MLRRCRLIRQVHENPGPQPETGFLLGNVDNDLVSKDGDILLDTSVPWYNYDVHPAKRLAYWLFRHLRKVPSDWRPYYRQLLRSEMNSCQYVNRPYDVFVCICDGYRKGKWVLQKYAIDFDEKKIPRPYNNFYAETTHEQRVWAHRRSFRLKELQALQRKTDNEKDVYGSTSVCSNDVMADWSFRGYQASNRAHTGNTVHSDDMAAPNEADIVDIDDEYTQVMMCTVIDERSWNPMAKARKYQREEDRDTELFDFEPADDDDEDDEQDDDGDEIERKRPRKPSFLSTQSGRGEKEEAGRPAWPEPISSSSTLDAGGGGTTGGRRPNPGAPPL